MRLISTLIVCLALSACATDYAAQLGEPGFGRTGMHYSEDNLDPTLMMDGFYASKLSNGAFCLTNSACSRQAPWWSSAWAP